MKPYSMMVVGGLLMCAAASAVAGGKSIPADGMGLSRESVFNVPAQHAYQDAGAMAGSGKVLPRSYLNAPPQIPHTVGDFLPITAETNMCAACHTRPDLWDAQRAKGDPTPIPKSHYTDLRNAPDKVGEAVVGARYNCVECHVAQMNAKPLVANTFGRGAR